MKASFFTLKIRIIIVLTTILFINSCKNNTVEFKYTDKEDLFLCESVNMALIKEALYSFEEDIKNNYPFKRPYSTLNGYATYWSTMTSDRLPKKEAISAHTLALFKLLKEDKELWNTSGDKITLNYNGKLMQCIGENLKDEGFKITFNALLETNSFKSKLFAPIINRKVSKIVNDKTLATYIALDLFYAKLFEMDFTEIE